MRVLHDAKSILSKEFLKAEYTEKRKTMRQIAEEQNVSVSAVFKYLKSFGIASRRGFTDEGLKRFREKMIGKSRNKGHKKSEETRRRMSEAKKGVYLKPSKYGGERKKRTDGYIAVFVPTHPFASNDGYVMEHHLVMEEHIGRYVQKDEVVHHINHDRADNRIENLQLMTFKEHASLHMTERHQKRRNGLSIPA